MHECKITLDFKAKTSLGGLILATQVATSEIKKGLYLKTCKYKLENLSND